ncbi:hypothetical protein B296_00035054 [Ensete ventricosum]|uniref:Aspartic peptidase DDI1-type domain-containing protein n=1 Tax=Ensete ventricosum TaxID=4639 RepID=A0A427A6H1_ENSVE|nr:hypothetical protein B296_00035054 [Ensete ventricosum]
MEKHPRQRDKLKITFGMGETKYPDHDNTLVISVWVANVGVKRVMVDTGSSVYMLYFDAFEKLRLTEKDLSSIASTITSFISDFISPLGTTTLLVTIGHEPKSKIIMVTYMVVHLPSAYNVILSCPALNKLRAIISTYHQTMKFPTRARISEVRSDPQESKKCYLMTIMLPKKLKLELRLPNTMSKSRLDQFDARAKPRD